MPDDKNLRVTMISKCIHELMYNVPQRPYFPYLPIQFMINEAYKQILGSVNNNAMQSKRQDFKDLCLQT